MTIVLPVGTLTLWVTTALFLVVALTPSRALYGRALEMRFMFLIFFTHSRALLVSFFFVLICEDCDFIVLRVRDPEQCLIRKLEIRK